jgi:1-acyl-sn-glycerol-3-phosphate acyltransferase
MPFMIASQNGSLFILHMWGRACLPMIKAVGNIDYEIRGEENITAQPVIYACKHQSAWDIVIVAALLPRVAFVLKKELLLIPLMGWFYIPRQKMIVVDRKKGGSALKKMVTRAKAAMHDRRSLLIYPEGTRRRPGMPPVYHPGIAALYAQLMVPVVPVALNSGVFWPRGSFFRKPGKIIVEFLPAIPPGLPGRELMREVQERIETASNRLMAEAGFVNPTTNESTENAPLRQKAG